MEVLASAFEHVLVVPSLAHAEIAGMLSFDSLPPGKLGALKAYLRADPYSDVAYDLSRIAESFGDRRRIYAVRISSDRRRIECPCRGRQWLLSFETTKFLCAVIGEAD